MRKFLFWPYQLYAWLFFFPVATVITIIAGWLVVILSWLISPRWASKHIARRWARLLAWLTPMPVTVEGAEHVDSSRSCVVVANHVSQFDILALYGWLDLDLKWVIKKELEKLPGIGIGCRKAGHIFVDRRNPEQARNAVNDALGRIRDGIGILFFAEGTRSLDGRLLPFKKGAFRIATNQGLPVLPVTVLGTGQVLPAKTMKLFPGRAKIVVHPMIEPVPDDASSLNDLMKRTRDSIASALPRAETSSNATSKT